MSSFIQYHTNNGGAKECLVVAASCRSGSGSPALSCGIGFRDRAADHDVAGSRGDSQRGDDTDLISDLSAGWAHARLRWQTFGPVPRARWRLAADETMPDTHSRGRCGRAQRRPRRRPDADLPGRSRPAGEHVTARTMSPRFAASTAARSILPLPEAGRQHADAEPRLRPRHRRCWECRDTSGRETLRPDVTRSRTLADLRRCRTACRLYRSARA